MTTSADVDKASRLFMKRMEDLYNSQHYFTASCFKGETKYSQRVNREGLGLQLYFYNSGYANSLLVLSAGSTTNITNSSSNTVTNISPIDNSQTFIINNNTYPETITIIREEVPPGSAGNGNPITVEGLVGGSPVITGSGGSVTGFVAGSTSLTFTGWVDRQVYVERGGQRLPQITNPYDYCSKNVSSPTIVFHTPLIAGELIYIETV